MEQGEDEQALVSSFLLCSCFPSFDFSPESRNGAPKPWVVPHFQSFALTRRAGRRGDSRASWERSPARAGTGPEAHLFPSAAHLRFPNLAPAPDGYTTVKLEIITGGGWKWGAGQGGGTSLAWKNGTRQTEGPGGMQCPCVPAPRRFPSRRPRPRRCAFPPRTRPGLGARGTGLPGPSLSPHPSPGLLPFRSRTCGLHDLIPHPESHRMGEKERRA